MNITFVITKARKSRSFLLFLAHTGICEYIKGLHRRVVNEQLYPTDSCKGVEDTPKPTLYDSCYRIPDGLPLRILMEDRLPLMKLHLPNARLNEVHSKL